MITLIKGNHTLLGIIGFRFGVEYTARKSWHYRLCGVSLVNRFHFDFGNRKIRPRCNFRLSCLDYLLTHQDHESRLKVIKDAAPAEPLTKSNIAEIAST